VWYNSTSGTLKSLVQIKAWSAGGNMTTARYTLAGTGTQTASIGMGGETPGSPNTNATEEYSGYAWTAGGNMNASKKEMGAAGTQTAGLIFGGIAPGPTLLNTTEEYDGSAWTAVPGTLNTARRTFDGSGIQTAALAFGGYIGPAYSNATEAYDGTSWTSGNPLITTRSNLTGAGTQTASLAYGGQPGPGAPGTTATESYDGTSWTTVNSLSQQRYAAAGDGLQTVAFSAGGYSGTANLSATEEWDGTNWSTSTSMGTARRALIGSGSRTAGLVFGGVVTVATGATEEYNSNINAITKAAWASGGNMNTGRQALSNAAGTQTASMAVGGNAGPPFTPSSGYLNTSEEYNGSSWTTGNNLGERTGYSGNSGTQTASIVSHNFIFNGTPPSLTPSTSYEYDGSTFSAVNNIAGSGRYGVAAFGTQTAAVAACGSIVPANSVTESEEYDGTSWTVGNPTIVERQRTTGTGTQTAGLMTAGFDNGPAVSYSPATVIELYDGTSWTAAAASINDGAWQRASFGTQTNALISGGNASPVRLNSTELYDGTAVSSNANLATGRAALGGAGTVTAGLVAAGDATPGSAYSTATEEYTEGSEAITASTLTTS